METIGEKIGCILRENNMNRRRVSEVLGLGRNTVSKWVNGEFAPRPTKIKRLIDFLGLDVRDFEQYYPPGTLDKDEVGENLGIPQNYKSPKYDTLHITYAARLKKIMADRHADIAYLANQLNVHPKQVERWLDEYEVPTLIYTLQISKCLDVSTRYLEYGRIETPRERFDRVKTWGGKR